MFSCMSSRWCFVCWESMVIVAGTSLYTTMKIWTPSFAFLRRSRSNRYCIGGGGQYMFIYSQAGLLDSSVLRLEVISIERSFNSPPRSR